MKYTMRKSNYPTKFLMFASTHLSLNLVISIFTSVRKSTNVHCVTESSRSATFLGATLKKFSSCIFWLKDVQRRDMPLFPHGEGIARGDHGVLGLGLAPHVREDLVQHVGSTGWRRKWTVWQWVVVARSQNLPLGCLHQAQLQ